MINRKTEELIDELALILDNEKYLLLKGGSSVGKTYLSKKIAEKLKKGSKEKVDIETIVFHPSYSYQDFIWGIIPETKDGKIFFEYQEKIFLAQIKKAIKSWEKNKKNEKYVLILDDINRGPIADVLGNALSLLEVHGSEKYTMNLEVGQVKIPPNFYIIATQNTAIETIFKVDYGIQRKLFQYTIESNIEYLYDDIENREKINLGAVNLYRNIESIVNNNLSYLFDKNGEGKKYLIGHGFFQERGLLKRIILQIIPMLKQYVKEGILLEQAKVEISRLYSELNVKYTLKKELAERDRIILNKIDITQKKFLEEEKTHKPLINIVARIKEQGLFNDSDIEKNILFNKKIIYREIKNKSVSGTLFGSKKALEEIKSVSGRALYKKREYIDICGNKYYVAGEIQTNEYMVWDEKNWTNDSVQQRNSTSPNIVLLQIIKFYYEMFIGNLSEYMIKENVDEEIEKLKRFAEEELSSFKKQFSEIVPSKSMLKNEANYQANKQVRELIGNLKLLWADIENELIGENREKIKVRGVYRMNLEIKYDEYVNTMEALGIKQMILQGPPGTSKTYSTRSLLKYIAEVNDEELNKLQIENYEVEDNCKYLQEGNENPGILWDIIQFHPSYGYEDFVRGIDISTENDKLVYTTIDKILGKISRLAIESKMKGKETKFFLVIDEINRANLATVFGELIYGLEYREEGVATPYIVNGSNKIKLPENLYIIGTMNTADKSIGGIDYAIRRRFLFFSLLPDCNQIKEYKITDENDDKTNEKIAKVNQVACNLFEKISKLFNEEYLSSDYYKEDVQIGHTYFLVDDEEQLYLRFKYQIIPILREYFKDGILELNVEQEETNGWLQFISHIGGNETLEDDELKKIFEEFIMIEREETE